MSDGRSLVPYQPEHTTTSYEGLRRLATVAVWREGDYKLAIHYLGRALQAGDFWAALKPNTPRILPKALAEENRLKAREVRSLGNIIRADYERRRKEARKIEQQEQNAALSRVGMGGRRFSSFASEVTRWNKGDQRDLKDRRRAVDNMAAYIAHMCSTNRYDARAFAELESMYDF